ncbi:hypothetical protein SASPL_157989 [Salvia splendens]|uniref:Protein XRI1 n=1 Tax=Salvia splendens TaxID=180675 RepID=A0A8X8VU02_SALSN|nr:hypothetical protein SASPL_157989 [Salvia splendens]
MSYNNNGSDMCGWRNQVYSLEDNTSIEASKSLMNEVEHNVDHISYMFDNETTPVKACGDLPYYVSNNGTSGKESELYRDHSSQVKRRRMLQFESEVLETPICNDEEFLRSKETEQSLEAAISDMSEWVAGFTNGMSAASNECLDPSSEGWMADCFNDPGVHLCNEDFNSACGGASDVQIDITGNLKTISVTSTSRLISQRSVNVLLQSFATLLLLMRSRTILVLALLETLSSKDINQRIHNPPKPKPAEDEYPTSAFSGKPVVGKTKIHTEGGKGSITIMRTKG